MGTTVLNAHADQLPSPLTARALLRRRLFFRTVPAKGSAASSRRPKSANQVSILVAHFARNPRPKKAEIKELVGRCVSLKSANYGRTVEKN